MFTVPLGRVVSSSLEQDAKIITAVAKVDNNKIVISMSEGRELDKAIRHMAINQDKLDAINYPKAPLDSYKKIAKAFPLKRINVIKY